MLNRKANDKKDEQ